MPRKKKVPQYSVEPALLIDIYDTIQRLDWPETESKHSRRIIDLISDLLKCLTPDQQEMFRLLIKSYHWCRFGSYIPLLEDTLDGLLPDDVKGMRNLAIFPAMAQRALENGKVKSGQAFIYPAKVQIAKNHPLLKHLKYLDMDNVRALEKHGLPRKTLTIFVDDFIGTGDTVLGVLDEYEKKYNSGVSRVIVACLVAQRIGYDRISDSGYRILANTIVDKGITDNPEIADKVKAFALMDEIESHLDIGANYRRGYKLSEALVTMARTPNNTFPVFWCGTRRSGETWPALFPRF